MVWFGLFRIEGKDRSGSVYFSLVRSGSVWSGFTLPSPKVAHDGLAAGVEAYELSEIVARDGDHALVLGLEQLDKLTRSKKRRGRTQKHTTTY